MLTITRVSKAMQELLVNQANELAVKTGFMQRERVLSGSSFVVGLMSGWQANPQASLAGLSQAVANAGTPISRQGLAMRLDDKAVAFVYALLKASLEIVVQAMPVGDGLLNRFQSVDLIDSSVISLPRSLAHVWQGSGGFGTNASTAALKLNVRWDVTTGHLKTLDLSAATQHDRHSAAYQQLPPSGSLQIADLGYFKLEDFEAFAQHGVYWLSRYKSGTKVFTLAGQEITLVHWLPQTIGDRLDCDIRLGQSQQLRCRLVAERSPLWVLRQRQERLRETARKNQTTVSATALEMAQWTIYLTNVPLETLAFEEVFVLGRYRWQIELLFKLWKSDLGVDQWASSKPERILVELYTKLIGAIVAHWLLLVACWHNPRRSLRQAIASVRGFAWQFANSLAHPDLLQLALHAFCRALTGCSMDKSQQAPRAFQLVHVDLT